MAVNALIGWGVGCDFYAKPEKLMYYRAVMEGMPAMDGGERSDPKIFFGKDTYKVIRCTGIPRDSWYASILRMSSTRGEFLGAKRIRGLFTASTHYDPSRANGEEKLNEQKELARKLLKGKAENLDRRSL
jgi:hypothetical protein